MISCYTNGSIFGLKKLSNECCYSKKWGCGHKSLNLIFFFIRKKHIVSRIRLVLTNIIIVIFNLFLVLLAITNLML